MLTLGVVGVARSRAVTRSSDQLLALRGLLAVLCGLTIVVVASALHRLDAYEAAFGLTRSRLAAEGIAWALVALFALLIGSLASVRLRRSLGSVVVFGAAAGLLVFSLTNPDGRIAQRNVARWHETGRFDIDYARSLSADAVPALEGLSVELRTGVLAPYRERLAAGEPRLSANLSRRRALGLLRASVEATIVRDDHEED